MIDQELRQLVQSCTVRLGIDQGGVGTGFFIAPGWIVTCAHVVKQARDTTRIRVVWKTARDDNNLLVGETTLSARVRFRSIDSIDLALLELIDRVQHPCVLVDNALPRLGDNLYVFGYPQDLSENYPNGDSVTTKYEGESRKEFVDLLKLKEGQIKPGFSGSPVLNLRTGGICGIVTTSRNVGTDLGGRAIPISLIMPSPKIPDLDSVTLQVLFRIVELYQEFHTRNRQWRKAVIKNANVRRTAYFCALWSLTAFIFIAFNTPDSVVTLSFFRLMIGVNFGFAIYLYVRSLDIEPSRMKGFPIASASCFAVALLVILLSFIVIPDKPIFLRNLTGTNEYPVFALIEDQFPTLLGRVLNIDSNPIIDKLNPIYQNIELFRNETGNQGLIKVDYADENRPQYRYSLNKRNKTDQGFYLGNKQRERQQFNQDQKSFEQDTVEYAGERQKFFYSSALESFRSGAENAKWTSLMYDSDLIRDRRINPKELSNVFLIQYPKLEDIKTFLPGRTDNTWMKSIINNNPDVRGFLGFEHRYVTALPPDKEEVLGLRFFGGCKTLIISNLSPTPYVIPIL